jgi:transglutaminase-like putative cysteine protease
LFNDGRQTLRKEGEDYIFESHRLQLDDFVPAHLPIVNPDVVPYIEATDLVQSNHPDLIARAREIVGDETDTLKMSAALCAWVDKNVKDTFSARLTNALEVLGSLSGDCTEHSILFIAMARALGIPAREVAGLIYVDGDPPGFYFHQWATIWVGKWIDVDPTFNQPQADVTHIKLAEGDLYHQARLIPIIGRLRIEVLPDTESLTATPPAETSAEEAP